MGSPDQLLFSWAYRRGEREFVIDVSRSGRCTLFDETTRRRCVRFGMDATEALLEDIAADEPSSARSRKMEFGVDFSVSEPLLKLLRQARLSYDETDDVPLHLVISVNALFDEVFDREVKEYLT